ncbi:hypothetical protein EDB89DRAFT_2068894 [Lactarius sanguifluus]|nr:hypothetical protein EDB89DRAFT_2068894 [Lactarius sanguifluus]
MTKIQVLSAVARYKYICIPYAPDPIHDIWSLSLPSSSVILSAVVAMFVIPGTLAVHKNRNSSLLREAINTIPPLRTRSYNHAAWQRQQQPEVLRLPVD